MKDETIYALISDEVYSRQAANGTNMALDIEGLTGAQFISSLDSGSGMYAEAWEVGGKIVIAFRGTDFAAPNSLDWTQGNFPLALGNPQAGQLQAAIAFVESIKEDLDGDLSNVVFAGHSLGGGLAGLMAAKYGNDAYVYAPAPFKKTSDAASFIPDGLDPDKADLLLAGPPTPPIGEGGVPQINDPTYQAALLAYNTAKAMRDTLVAVGYTKIHSYALNDEVLQKFTQTGPVNFVSGLLGVQHFDPAPDVSFTVGGSSGINESLAKHSISLHALLARTDSRTNNEGGWTSKPIGGAQGLLTNDAALRNAFLTTPGNTGPINSITRDNVGTDPDPGMMFRALVSDIDFYSQFYTRFGTWLSAGVAGKDKSATSDALTAHSGVVKLGLQVVRDALNDSGSGPLVGDAGLNIFGAGDANGPTAPYVRVDLANITAPGGSAQKEKLAVNGIEQFFGVRDINFTIAKAAEAALISAVGSSATIGDFAALDTLLGASSLEIKNGFKGLSDWQVLIVQAGGTSELDKAISYDASATTNDGARAHVVIGGNNVDTIKGSTQRDFLLGGAGNDTLDGGGGKDFIIGDAGKDRYIAHTGPTDSDSVIFMGGEGVDTAVYGSDFENIGLRITGSRMPNVSNGFGVEVSYSTAGNRVDTLIGVEEIELRAGNDFATFSEAAKGHNIAVNLAQGNNTVNRTKETNSAPSGEPVEKGAVLTLKFATLGVAGPQQQTLNMASDFDPTQRANASIFVNGHQLSGGATFDFDKFDLVSNGNVKPIYLMNSSQSYPTVATFDRVSSWLGTQVEAVVEYLGGLVGNVPGVNAISMGPLLGLTFAPILFAAIGKFVGSWNTGYIQTIVGVYGERYDLGTLASDGTRTLTVTMNPSTDGAGQTIVINSWKQGDYGIQIKQLGYENGLDSGTNKNGQLDSWLNMSLDTIRARLAEVGIVAPAEKIQTRPEAPPTTIRRHWSASAIRPTTTSRAAVATTCFAAIRATTISLAVTAATPMSSPSAMGTMSSRICRPRARSSASSTAWTYRRSASSWSTAIPASRICSSPMVRATAS